jgi:hypothetical protein
MVRSSGQLHSGAPEWARATEGRAWVPPAFQFYRFSDDTAVWWRLVSPNGRGLARSAAAHPSVAVARSSLDAVLAVLAVPPGPAGPAVPAVSAGPAGPAVPAGPAGADGLELGVRLTPTYRWHWSLKLAGAPVAEGIGDQDRRVRCLDAGRKFQLLARVAPVEPEVAVFRREPAAPRTARAQDVTRS